jgi:hypothetical protein
MGHDDLMVRAEHLEKFLGEGDPVLAVQHHDRRPGAVVRDVDVALPDRSLFTLHVNTPPNLF